MEQEQYHTVYKARVSHWEWTKIKNKKEWSKGKKEGRGEKKHKRRVQGTGERRQEKEKERAVEKKNNNNVESMENMVQKKEINQ